MQAYYAIGAEWGGRFDFGPPLFITIMKTANRIDRALSQGRVETMLAEKKFLETQLVAIKSRLAKINEKIKAEQKSVEAK
jgi:hypothetical protein